MRHSKTQRGFTLLELLVAASVFVGVMAMAVGLFISASRAQRKIEAIQNVEDNARFLMEFLTKEFRVSEFDAVAGCASPMGGGGLQCSTFTVTRTSGGTFTYTFDGSGNILRDEAGDGFPGSAINAADIVIDGFFDVRGIGPNNGQPVVTIVMDVVQPSSRVGEGADLQFQSTIAERTPDREH